MKNVAFGCGAIKNNNFKSYILYPVENSLYAVENIYTIKDVAFLKKIKKDLEARHLEHLYSSPIELWLTCDWTIQDPQGEPNN